MKVRKSFVANSSSTAYICDVCMYSTSGFDMDLFDANMYECINGHTFCEEHVLGDPSKMPKEDVIKSLENIQERDWYNNEEKEEARKMLSEILAIKNQEEWNKYYEENNLDDFFEYDGRYQISDKYCPICQLQVTTDYMKLMYLLKKNGMTEEDVDKEIKNNFKDYAELSDFARSK